MRESLGVADDALVKVHRHVSLARLDSAVPQLLDRVLQLISVLLREPCDVASRVPRRVELRLIHFKLTGAQQRHVQL